MAGAFSRKASGISCDLTAFRKIKEHRANAVETPLGVTGLLGSKISLASISESSCLWLASVAEQPGAGCSKLIS